MWRIVLLDKTVIDCKEYKIEYSGSPFVAGFTKGAIPALPLFIRAKKAKVGQNPELKEGEILIPLSSVLYMYEIK